MGVRIINKTRLNKIWSNLKYSYFEIFLIFMCMRNSYITFMFQRKEKPEEEEGGQKIPRHPLL